MSSVLPTQQLTLAVLAGGRARRLGGVDKGLVIWRGKPLIEHVLERLAGQAASCLIVANRNGERYRSYTPAVYADTLAGFQGPLAGMATALEHASTEWVLCVPCDTPLLPAELPARLWAAAVREGAAVSLPADGRVQYAVCLLKRSCLHSLNQALAAGERSLRGWLDTQRPAMADFSGRPGAFANLNTPEDLERAEGPLPVAEGARR